MKLLSVVVPCYNSQDYMAHAVDSLLPGGDDVEILIVDDGSHDNTAAIADDYQSRFPGIVRAIHQPNAGHGGAVMAGIRNATGLYFKVVDSDDWVDDKAYPRVLAALKNHISQPLDMLVSNYIYDKAGEENKHVVHYRNALPQGRVFGWNEAGHFHKGQYLLMHAVIYRTQLLRDCGIDLPLHTFYVDDLYVYEPLPHVEKMMYLDADLYHYFIGRDDQSVHEQVMLRRIDQYLKVNKLMISRVNPFKDENRARRDYMLNFLEIITIVSTVMLIKSEKTGSLNGQKQLWDWIKAENPDVYNALRHRLSGVLLHLPLRIRRPVVTAGYGISRKIFGFN